MSFVSIVTPCYNEEENVEELYRQIKDVMAGIEDLDYEHVYIDNASTDRTQEKLRQLAARDPRVKLIFNTRNFGHIRSPYYAVLQTRGDAVICLVSDLQDPPSLIKEFVAKWREGYKVVIGVKTKSEESYAFYLLRTIYYRFLRSLSDVDLIEHFTGFGLYDREVVEQLRNLNDSYPYMRGLIADLGYEFARIEYTQSQRKRGISKNNFYSLYDVAMLGLTSHTKVPLRLATMFGFLIASLSFLVGMIYLIYKLVYWDTFSAGLAPLVVGLFFFGAIQLIFLGIVGEYVGAIYTQVLHRPLVIEKERINFDPCADQPRPR